MVLNSFQILQVPAIILLNDCRKHVVSVCVVHVDDKVLGSKAAVHALVIYVAESRLKKEFDVVPEGFLAQPFWRDHGSGSLEDVLFKMD